MYRGMFCEARVQRLVAQALIANGPGEHRIATSIPSVVPLNTTADLPEIASGTPMAFTAIVAALSLLSVKHS